MRFRRLILLASILFVVAALMSASAPRRGPVTESLEPPRVLADGPHSVVQGELPKQKVVTAEVGDIIDLTVTAKAADEAYVEGLGIDIPVEPDVPGRLRMIVERAGDFPVRLMWAEQRVGVLEVVDGR